MRVMVQWLHGLLSQQSFSTEDTSILDVGTGNALLPLALAKLGYKKLTGSDYSHHSIALARQLVQRHSQGHAHEQVRLVVRASLSFMRFTFLLAHLSVFLLYHEVIPAPPPPYHKC